ncbi:MAG TPA: hypothetical protein VLA71_12030 [Algoriphagus sp.]|nr:hypothetical protein [Algoriphagus sp.]
MKHFRSLGLLLLLFAGLLTACEETIEEPTNPLVAEAGDEQELVTNSVTLLDASQSVNSTGKPVSYKWELVEKPEGAEAETSAMDKVAVEFSANKAGDYVFKLTVTYLNWSATDRVKIKVVPGEASKIEARAGDDKQVAVETLIQLDGSGSVNELGGILQYGWTLIEKPEGSIAQIQNPDLAVAKFQPDKAGKYLIKLAVKFQSSVSFDLVEITVTSPNGAEGPILISEDILQSRVLENIYVEKDQLFDYLVTKDIEVAANLLIKPGVRVAFEAGAKLTVSTNGILIADNRTSQGTIVFQGKSAEKGYWEGILIESQSEHNMLWGTEIRDAGQMDAALKVAPGGNITVISSKIYHNSKFGIILPEDASFAEFKVNEIYDNTDGPLVIAAERVALLSSENTIKDGNIRVSPGRIDNGLEHIWPNFTSQYDLLDDLVVTAASTWAISDGAHVNVANDRAIRIIQGSKMVLLGLDGKPVVIEGMTKEKGAWRGIYLDNSQGNSSSIIKAEIRHAGSNAISGSEPATLKIGTNGSIAISRTVFDQGKGNGLDATSNGVSLVFDLNTITNHQGHPIVVSTSLVENLDYTTAMENNGKNEVAVDGLIAIGVPGREVIWKGFYGGTPYVITGMGDNLLVQSGLRIKQGVRIKMQPGTRIDVVDSGGMLGYLHLEGGNGAPVVIQGTDETAGSWYGITYSTNHLQNVVRNARILHAGKVMSNNFSAAITVDNVPQGSLTVDKTFIGKSGQHGIAVVKTSENSLKTTEVIFEEVPGNNVHIW